MCGIVGFIGEQDAKEILLKGLEKLEYRGYDSAGIAVQAENGVVVYKEKGRIAKLREIVDENVATSVGIGHTLGYTWCSEQSKRASASKYIKAFYTSS